MMRRAYEWAKDFQLGLLVVVAAALLLAGLVMLVRKRMAARRKLAASAQKNGLAPCGGVEAPIGRGSSVPMRASARD
jgi:hypothetical protein